MADIICATECTGGLEMPAFPDSCGRVDFGFPKLIILALKDSVTCTGSDYLVPSVSDFQSAIGSDCIIINDLANGVKIPEEVEEIGPADTADNLPEYVNAREGITGNLKNINLEILNALEKLNCHSRLQMWYVTNKGWCFGGREGYTIPWYSRDWEHAGYGPNKSMIPISCTWVRKPETTGADQDYDYLELVNS
ncbi:MAG: hypothetical protein PHE46_11050 [Bacteroidales bacterium]|nr:hypothetical protein [Bacteroidales bacterium]